MAHSAAGDAHLPLNRRDPAADLGAVVADAWGTLGAHALEEQKTAATVGADVGDAPADVMPGDTINIGPSGKKHTWTLLSETTSLLVKCKHPWHPASELKPGLLDGDPLKDADAARDLLFRVCHNADLEKEVSTCACVHCWRACRSGA